MYSKIKQFLNMVPKDLTSANEIYNFARNAYKQIMGVFPDGLDNVFLKRGAAEMQDVRQKVVKFPEGGKDKTDFFSTRPDPRLKQPKGAKMDVQRAHENISGGSGYAEGDTKYNADILGTELARVRGFIDEGQDATDMDPKEYSKLYDEAYSYLTGLRFLNRPPKKEGVKSIDLAKELEELTNKNLKERGLGEIKLGDKLPPPKNKKPDVDPVLQQSEDQKQMFLDFENRNETEAEIIARMNRQNKEAVKRLKEKKIKKFEQDNERALEDYVDDAGGTKEGVEFDDEPFDAADGGRIGFDKGGEAGYAGDPMEGDQYVISDIPGNPQVPMGQFGPLNVGIFGGGSYGKNEIIPGVDMATTNQNYGIVGQLPIGKTGFSIGGNYLKSRVNERFTGGNNQVFKTVPTDSDRFNIGINFRKQFKDGSKPPNFGRRNFLKLMGGLASIPIIGKYFKPAAKVADKAAPVIQEGVKLGYENFMLLVDKIKRFGKPADDLATQERQRVTTYSGKNGNEYELVEDLTTGDMTITKDKTGFIGDADQTIDVIEDRSTFIYKKGEDIVDTKTGKSKRTPDEYDEVKQTSSGPEDAFDDVTEIDDRSVNEVIDELRGSAEMDDLTLSQTLGPGSPRSKKAGGGLAYMLGE